MTETTHPLDGLGEIRNEDLTGGTVLMSEGECRGFIRSTLREGTLKLAQKGWASVLLSTVEDCNVVAAKRQRDFRFFRARFIGCSFFGTYSGIDFGRRGEVEVEGDFGSVENCDFTNAVLDGCRFFNVEVSTLRLPRWPHVVVEKPHLLADLVAAIDWPGHLGEYMEICTNKPSSLSATVIHIPSLAQFVRCTEEEARQAFEQLGDVLM